MIIKINVIFPSKSGTLKNRCLRGSQERKEEVLIFCVQTKRKSKLSHSLKTIISFLSIFVALSLLRFSYLETTDILFTGCKFLYHASIAFLQKYTFDFVSREPQFRMNGEQQFELHESLGRRLRIITQNKS